ncbi:hypothetical protein PRIPAC_97577 [Pristionchus pacificus]|uniref:Uncharacterized protein n=1 Tax=Pristionchus pacificus TaxID=54126 RepID=A0A2A6D2C8_PRIPA|nr:hypothetical protein PRIPAC_97577 [Pristionchus pacificus]|eukprot:PDM84540.1 hypothetical protein PRIPAC_33563 [Pristionchus pacificus]
MSMPTVFSILENTYSRRPCTILRHLAVLFPRKISTVGRGNFILHSRSRDGRSSSVSLGNRMSIALLVHFKRRTHDGFPTSQVICSQERHHSKRLHRLRCWMIYVNHHMSSTKRFHPLALRHSEYEDPTPLPKDTILQAHCLDIRIKYEI